MINFKQEDKRIRQYKKQGKSESWIKGWLRGYRLVGERTRKRT